MFYVFMAFLQSVYVRSSECSTGTSDVTRNPLIGPKYHVCIFEHDPWCSPHRVHVTGTFLCQMLYKNMYIIFCVVFLDPTSLFLFIIIVFFLVLFMAYY